MTAPLYLAFLVYFVEINALLVIETNCYYQYDLDNLDKGISCKLQVQRI